MDPVGDFQRRQYAADMCFDGAFTHGRPGRDVRIGVSLGQQGKNVALARSETVEQPLSRSGPGPAGGVTAVDEATGRGRMEDG